MSIPDKFYQAVSRNAVKAVRGFLRKGERPTASACSLAIRCKANEVLRVLIKAGANVNEPEDRRGGYTPLVRAVHEKNYAAFKLLLNSGASINKLGSWSAPLHAAAEEGFTEFAKRCITAGAKLELRDRSGNTPLMLAASMGRVNVVKLLLKAGANPCALNLVGRTACELAAENNESETVRLLQPVSHRRPSHKRGVPALFEAVANEDEAAVEKCLINNVDVNGRDRLGRSPMSKAIVLGCVPIVQRLVQAGIDLNKVSPDGTSFLEGALRAEKWEIAKLLLNAGAVPNPPGNRLGDPISTAIFSNDTDLMRLLADKGSNPRATGLLISAARAKRPEIVRFLLSNGADVNEQDTDGWTPLFWAVFDPISFSEKHRAKLLRPSGIEGLTPAVAPKPSRVAELVSLLIEHGAEVSHVDKEGRTASVIAKSPRLSKFLKPATTSRSRAKGRPR